MENDYFSLFCLFNPLEIFGFILISYVHRVATYKLYFYFSINFWTHTNFNKNTWPHPQWLLVVYVVKGCPEMESIKVKMVTNSDSAPFHVYSVFYSASYMPSSDCFFDRLKLMTLHAGGMSRFIQPQECIITLKSADNAVVKRHGPRPPPHAHGIILVIS